MKNLALAAAIATLATGAVAAPEKYMLDSSHSQIVFNYDHLGFSTTFGMFSGFEGEIMFDQEDPANSSVNVSMPVTSMFTGWEQRDAHFMSGDFFDANDEELVTFSSTSIEVTGEDTAMITGDLTLNGITKEVVLDAKLNKAGPNPLNQTEWAGFDATTTLKRTDFGVGMFAGPVSDEVNVMISIEAQKAG
ncbi:YceI family protein [Shimia ponticola]|uniref:YceI family protein n=1 Tax=Shimia ponticola TaxID=2582893 RepID=UPI0011BF6A38|nr:YceI family protein [Shimia ponticola]